MKIIPNPAATILTIIASGTADHIMAQYFTDKVAGMPTPRAGSDKGCVLWFDGRVSLESPGSVFDPSKGIDRFHPTKAR